MAYEYGKRPRSDGGSYGMAPPPKRLAPQDYGGMPSNRRESSYGDYPQAQQKMGSRPPPGPGIHEEKPSNVLLFTVYNPKYPITVDVMHTITSPHGTVNRIVIFRKNGVQAMVEFETVDEADRAREALNGADIYSGCCTLKVEWGKPSRLNVTKNDSESWDYTNPNLGKEPKSQPLLPDPKFQPQMYGNSGEGMPPPRRGAPPADYGYDNYGGPEPVAHEQYGPPGGRYPPPPRPQPMYNDDMYGPPQRPQMRGPPPPGGRGPPMERDRPQPRGQPYGGAMDYDNMGGDQEGGAMYQQGAVLMVYGLNHEKMNCQRLFNLFCLYGNVVRIKFLKSKEGVAMVQMGDSASCRRAIDNLNNCYIFNCKLVLGVSKQAFIQDVPNPIDLPDGSKSFEDFMGSRNNRFTTPEAAAKNRIQPASKLLYFFNAPPNVEEETIRKIFIDQDLKPPEKVKIFAARSERSSTGFLEWDNKGDAIEALVVANHIQLPNPTGKNPYVLKMCFTGAQKQQ
jgi:heterogeneous nuclear ribonucleoprotein L